MIEAAVWFLVAGGVFVVMALSASVVRRLPLTTGLLYLGIGVVLGPYALGLVHLDPVVQSSLLERATEVAVIVSLFTAGLKLRTPLLDPLWRLPGRLALTSMTVTVALVTVVGVYVLGLPLGAAVLLGAVLAPTDPVLASDVQVENPADRDRLRFGLTGEAGLNDGTAFPFVMLGLGLLGTHDLGAFGWRWLAVDVLWAVAAGLVIGGGLGTLVGRLVIYLRRERREAVGLDDFLALGLIALAYGAALLAHAYGFLAVFAAGLALRRIEAHASGATAPEEVVEAAQAFEGGGDASEEIATDPEKAPAYMAQAVLGFNEQLERIAEVVVVVALGAMLGLPFLSAATLWFAPLLFLVIRPVAVAVGLIGSRTPPLQFLLIAWFGVRGVGSIYYLMFALQHGLATAAPDAARDLTALTLCVVASSILVHGISVTPLMNLYKSARRGESGAERAGSGTSRGR